MLLYNPIIGLVQINIKEVLVILWVGTLISIFKTFFIKLLTKLKLYYIEYDDYICYPSSSARQLMIKNFKKP